MSKGTPCNKPICFAIINRKTIKFYHKLRSNFEKFLHPIAKTFVFQQFFATLYNADLGNFSPKIKQKVPYKAFSHFHIQTAIFLPLASFYHSLINSDKFSCKTAKKCPEIQRFQGTCKPADIIPTRLPNLSLVSTSGE